MRPLALALLALLLVPVAAGAKDSDAPVRVLWNSAPDGIRARGTWDARVSVLQGPGGFPKANLRPVIVVTDLAGHAERRVPMTIDVPPNTFKATVPFARAGLYEVAVARFDPSDPERFTDVGPPDRIGPAAAPVAAATEGGESWPWTLAVGAALAALLAPWGIQRIRVRTAG